MYTNGKMGWETTPPTRIFRFCQPLLALANEHVTALVDRTRLGWDAQYKLEIELRIIEHWTYLVVLIVDQAPVFETLLREAR
mgnify:FL=1